MNVTPLPPDSDQRECFERAQHERRPLACLLIAIDRIERLSDAGLCEALRAAVDGLVAHEPEAHDWQTSRAEGRVLVLCPGLAVQDAPPAARRLVEEARKLRISYGQRKLRVTLSIGIAHNHKHPELVYEAFVGVASESLGVAQGAGGNRWVHTELYDMLRRRFPDRAPAAPPEVRAAPAAPLPSAPTVSATPPPTSSGPVEPPGVAPRDTPRVAPEVVPGAVVNVRLPAGFIPRSTPAPAAAVPSLPRPLEEFVPSSETIDILQRRVRKLANALEQAEEQIASLRGEQAEAGIASIYRTVQGLAPDEACLDLKRKLMFDIYEANRQLQQVAQN